MPRVFSPEQLAKGIKGFGDKALEDLAGREQDIQRGKTVELLRRAGKEMYENPIVNTAVGLSPVLGDIQAGVEAYRSAQEGDLGNAGLNAVGMLPFIPMLGKTVWHGSPHTFEKFDLSKIGTGEGAQAYGHGLYFAESPETAKAYRDTLSKSEKQFYVKGNRVEPEMLDAFESNVLNAKGYGRNKQDYLEELELNRVSPSAIQQMSKVWDEMGDVTVKDVLPENASLYKVDLPDEQIAKMLDWDKSLAEQPEVYKAIENYARETQGNPEAAMRMLEGKTAGEAYSMWSQPEYVSQFLNEQGVPGIQYLDQASRGAGDGTRNYVVFSDEIPQILERNNQPLVNALRQPKEMPISDLKLNEGGESIAKSAWTWDKDYVHKNTNPISVVRLPSGEPYVLDGYHRIEQAKRGGQKNIQVNEVPLTEEIKSLLISDKVLPQE